MTERSSVLISIESGTADQLRKAILSGLYSYNEQFAGPMDNSVLMVGARDAEKNIIGGLIANLQSGWKWIHLERLWVAESYRRTGIGRLLVETAEQEGRKQGCLHVAVDTFEFQAREFYEKQGYHVYAVLEDYPAGHRKFMLRKTL
jgi:GNAT superfamily N-acetyltransferase